MSKQKKISLLAGHNRSANTTSAKDEIMAMKYTMDKPSLPVYSLDDKLQPKTYPDYIPWEDDESLKDKLKNSGYLNKGYFEIPLVSNEYYSARNLIQETLFSSTQNCTTILKELSQHFTKAYKTRNEVINKISYAPNNFKVPPRVTLTAAKKEAWLKDLANQDVPLLTVSAKLPHGIRNKILVDSMCNYGVPISRAIWFTKCSLYSELLLLRRKYQSKQNSFPQPGSVNLPPIDVFEVRWLQEWTQQVADYTFKFSKNMPNIGSSERKGPFQTKLNYLLGFVLSLYVECLIDRSFFLTSVINLLRDDLPFETADLAILLDLAKAEEGEEIPILSQLLMGRSVNYGQILVALTLITMFWKDILEEDFLCKYLSESLLLNYFLIEKLPVISGKTSSSIIASSLLLEKIKYEMLLLIATSINNLFKHNTNVFIVPNYWVLIGDVLLQVLMKDETLTDPIQEENLKKVLQLINYRNESLMLNMKYLVRDENSEVSPQAAQRRNSFLDVDYQSASSKSRSQRVEEAEHTYINRSSDDNLKFVEQLDKLKLNNSLTALLKPRPSSQNSNSWRIKLKIVVYWCVTVYRDMGPSSEKILIICNYLKRKVLQALTTRGSSYLKAEFENELLESIFSLSQEPVENLSMYNLYVLINELYQLKIISISSYLRKIIACGVFYKSPHDDENVSQLSNDPQIRFHLSILQNLPVLNNRQCDHILKKWTLQGFNFLDHFTRGTNIIQESILDRLTNNSFGLEYRESLQEIKSLNVGVKFLLVNWLTSQIKKTISNSPKLIHITPSTIANIYQFYAITDNLTVFFKVFVKYVLKNDNKVIIFYLETLYFISKLILNHYNLVKFIAGNSYEAVSDAYELFKLVILSYKDLLSRETDIYHFKDVWQFIDYSLEKASSAERVQYNNAKSGLDKLFNGKETVESPLKISAHATRQNDSYSAENFKNDLTSLLAFNGQHLSVEDLNDCLREICHLELQLEIKGFTDVNNAEQTISSILHGWYQRAGLLTESEDLIFFKLLKTVKNNLKPSSGTVFLSGIKNFVAERILEAKDSVALGLMLAKLLTYELILIEELFYSVRKIQNADIDWIIELFTFGSENIFQRLFSYQDLLLKHIREEYIKKHFDDVLTYSLEKFKVEGMAAESGVFARNRDVILNVVRDALIFNRKWTMHCFLSELLTKDLIRMWDQLLPSRFRMQNTDDMAHLAMASNEFSLPIIQTMLQVVTSEVCEPENAQTMASSILDNLHFLFGPCNSFFGEMFNYLDWSCKLQIFKYLEKVFLTQIQFELVWDLENAMVTEDVHYVSLRLNQDGIELIPIFKDFFKKFSVSSVDKLDTPTELFQDLSAFLVKLLHLLSNQNAMQLDDKTIHDTISIFLRLLIIHKSSLTSALAREDLVNFVFLKNLVALLNSSYLANGHDKLRILLYDLLLLMKGSLTQALSVASDETLIAASPAPPPQNSGHSPSAPADDKKDPGDLPQNAGDYGGTALSTMSAILNLPEPTTTVPFEVSGGPEDESAIVLDEDELKYDGDINFVNQSGLVLTHCRRDSMTFTPFVAHNEHPSLPFAIKSLKLIEDTGSGPNDGCIDLSLFDAYTTKENPL